MPKKSLSNKIEKKLNQLHDLLDKIEEARVINSDDPDSWDTDTLYNLVEDLKTTLQLLEDQKSKELNDWGEPIILEEGLCSLVDNYQSEEEDI